MQSSWKRAFTRCSLAVLVSGGAPILHALAGGAEDQAASTIVMLGDSITKGTRAGVQPQETFAAIVERELNAAGIGVRVVNAGISGERTDQALERLDAIIAERPVVVTVMYGTNDSYVDQGQDASRLSLAAYRENLRTMVERLLLAGIEPVLMTEPRWAADAAPNGLGENPNVKLDAFMNACREVAAACDVTLIDHFAMWSQAEDDGQALREWTTDGCHPNPLGHRQIADKIMPVLQGSLQPEAQPVKLGIALQTVLQHDDSRFLWFHPRVAALPRRSPEGATAVLMTMQKHLFTSDHYSGLSVLRTEDGGATWSDPAAPDELAWVHEPSGVHVAVADVTPGWHAPSGKVLAVGAQVRYSTEGHQLEDRPRSHQTAYAIYDPESNTWSHWQRLEMPPGEKFNFARSACAQWIMERDGTLLLPFYCSSSAKTPHFVTVVRCAFDGQQLTYLEHGDEITLDVVRGLVEPSLARHADRYFLTIRNDLAAYVTVSDDGLHYRPIKAWTFDDGEPLGSYNTQQHWLVQGGGLFLVYTRRGANNDHITRHRAPLFVAQVDPGRLCVLRATEKIAVPERGATLGNFGVARISDDESWITVAEGVWNNEARQRGADGSVFVARVTSAESE